MTVRFVKGTGRRYRSVFRRADGVEVTFDGGTAVVAEPDEVLEVELRLA